MIEGLRTLRRLIRSGACRPQAPVIAGPGGPGLPPEVGHALVPGLRAAGLLQDDGVPVPRLRHVTPVWLLAGVDVLIEVAGGPALIEATETRRLLEPAAAALAADRITPEHLTEIGHLLHQSRMARPRPEVLTRYDAELHRVIVAAAGNRPLGAMAGRLVAITAGARLWRSVAAEAPPVAWRTELEAVHQALQARDPELARFTAEAHVQACETFLRAMAAAVVSPSAGSAAASRLR